MCVCVCVCVNIPVYIHAYVCTDNAILRLSRSMNFCSLCTRVFDRRDRNNMDFDDFIQCCVMIKMLTDSFRKKDMNQNGVINISYEEVHYKWHAIFMCNVFYLCTYICECMSGILHACV